MLRKANILSVCPTCGAKNCSRHPQQKSGSGWGLMVVLGAIILISMVVFTSV